MDLVETTSCILTAVPKLYSSTAGCVVGELPLVAGWLQVSVRCGGPLRTQSVSSGKDDPRRVGSVLAEAIVGDGEHGGPLRLIRPNDAVVELVEQAMQ